jgi:hypothetical protein
MEKIMTIQDQPIISLDYDEESKNFSYRGCENCANGLGTDVYDSKAYVADFSYYDLKLCHTCLCSYHNADPLDENCRNVFNI